MGKQHHDKMGVHNPLSLHRSLVIHYPAGLGDRVKRFPTDSALSLASLLTMIFRGPA